MRQDVVLLDRLTGKTLHSIMSNTDNLSIFLAKTCRIYNLSLKNTASVYAVDNDAGEVATAYSWIQLGYSLPHSQTICARALPIVIETDVVQYRHKDGTNVTYGDLSRAELKLQLKNGDIVASRVDTKEYETAVVFSIKDLIDSGEIAKQEPPSFAGIYKQFLVKSKSINCSEVAKQIMHMRLSTVDKSFKGNVELDKSIIEEQSLLSELEVAFRLSNLFMIEYLNSKEVNWLKGNEEHSAKLESSFASLISIVDACKNYNALYKPKRKHKGVD